MKRVLRMQGRAEGDPRCSPEYTWLCNELAKLTHPACPHVDWVKVEQWCLTLFSAHGRALHVVVPYALARSQLYGVRGMVQGAGLIEAALDDEQTVWSCEASARADILAWWFAQLQVLLRCQTLSHVDLAELGLLEASLGRLHSVLLRHNHGAVITLQALRQQLNTRVLREQTTLAPAQLMLPEAAIASPVFPGPLPLASVVFLPAVSQAEPPPAHVVSWHPLACWLAVAMLVLAAIASVRLLTEPRADGTSLFAPIFMPQPQSPDVVHLNGLRVFEAGNAALAADVDASLINALVEIKARPDWLIFITGHSDGTGDDARNRQLSYARASTVRDWLQRHGDVPDGCFVVQGAAASQPVASDDSASGRAANRRVDIRLVPSLGQIGRACSSEGSR